MKEQIEVDSHKLIYHPERVAEWRSRGDCAPIYVEIGPTNRCNHRCSFCALDWLETGKADIDSEIMIETLKDMADFGVKSVMFAGEGEPLLHRDICDFVWQSKEQGMDVAITTNGVPFTQKKAEKCLPHLSWMRFSIDAGTPKEYARVHGTRAEDFHRVLRNLERACTIRDTGGYQVVIGVQALLTTDALEGISNLARLAKKVGADNLQIKPYSQHPSSKNRLAIDYRDYLSLEDELNEHNSDDFEVIFRKKTIQRLIQKRDYKKCHGLPFFALIDARGNVLPCNLFYGDPELTYGNLYSKRFSEIWKGKKRTDVLAKLEEKGIEGCREGCRLDAINRYLHRLQHPHPHDRFI